MVQDILRGRRIDHGRLRTLNDMKLLQLGWVYDVNFIVTLKRIKQCRYLEMIAELLPDTKDIDKVSGPDTKLLASNDVAARADGQVVTPGLAVELDGVKVTGVAAYNPAKHFHPRRNQWLGFVVDIGGKRIYYAGDTDLIDEMKELKDIDLALLPVGGTYTMNAGEAAEAVGRIGPKQAVPYHWGDIVGAAGDAEQFAEKAQCEVKVLKPGDSLSL